MKADSRVVDSFDGKTVVLNELASGDTELIISKWGWLMPGEAGRGREILAKCVLTPKQFGELVMPSILVRRPKR
jgi:hypothetical protein